VSEKSSDDMKTPQAATLQERPAFLPPLERMRRERRLTLLFFTGFMLLAALFHLLASEHSPAEALAVPHAVTEEHLP
jgi:uncharacterized protein involved in exopolysaccharide biosynthesis